MGRAWLLVGLLAFACVGCDVAKAADPAAPGAPGAPAPVQPGTPAAPAPGAPAAPTAPAPGASAPVATAAPTDAPAATARVTARPAPTAPPKTNPPGPVTGARVSISPTSGKAGSSFVFQFAGFMPGGVNFTFTGPTGVSRTLGASVALDGTGRFTYTTKATDAIGGYTVKVDGGGFSATTAFQLTAP
jgi:hypothetical protein